MADGGLQKANTKIQHSSSSETNKTLTSTPCVNPLCSTGIEGFQLLVPGEKIHNDGDEPIPGNKYLPDI